MAGNSTEHGYIFALEDCDQEGIAGLVSAVSMSDALAQIQMLYPKLIEITMRSVPELTMTSDATWQFKNNTNSTKRYRHPIMLSDPDLSWILEIDVDPQGKVTLKGV